MSDMRDMKLLSQPFSMIRARQRFRADKVELLLRWCRMLATAVLLQFGMSCMVAAETLPTLPGSERPWLNEPALSGRAGQEIGGKLARTFADLARFPSDDKVDRLFTALWSLPCEGADPLAAERALIEARQRSKTRDYGVNFDAGLRIDPDTGDPDSGGHNLYAGVSWDYYRDGLWSNRLQAKSLNLQGELSQARQAQTEARRHLDCRHTRFIAAFNELKLKLLAEREAYLKMLHGVYRQAYFQGVMNLDEMIPIERDLERTRHLAAGFRSFNANLAARGGGGGAGGEGRGGGGVGGGGGWGGGGGGGRGR
jgi:uncharacterized membrane protein YgcG